MNTILRKETVFVTTDYSAFKRIDFNREKVERRAKKVEPSLRKNGYNDRMPIIVNERMEVVDGQARLFACEKLRIPIAYVVRKDASINDARVINSVNSVWSCEDYWTSYAREGLIPYIYLKNLMDMYGNVFQQNVIFFALTGKKCLSKKLIAGGDFECSSEQYEETIKALDMLAKFTPIISKILGRIEFYYDAILFATKVCKFDVNRLLKAITLRQTDLLPVTSIQYALEIIEKVYNFGRSKKQYLVDKYKSWQEERNTWYATKYARLYKEAADD